MTRVGSVLVALVISVSTLALQQGDDWFPDIGEWFGGAPAGDRTQPTTTITGGPLEGGEEPDGLLSLSFTSDDSRATFQCKLDGPGAANTYAPCISPKTYTSLQDGAFTFSVYAKDRAGNTDQSPATRSFSVNLAGSGPTGPGVDVLTSADCDRTFGTLNGVDQSGLQTAINTTMQDGEVLCLRGGSYYESDGELNLSDGGTATASKVVASYPGETAELRTSVVVDGAMDYLQLGPDLKLEGHYGKPHYNPNSTGIQNCPDDPAYGGNGNGIGDEVGCKRINTGHTIEVKAGAVGLIVRDSEITNRDPAWKTGPYTDNHTVGGADNDTIINTPDGQPDIFEREGSCWHAGGNSAGAAIQVTVVRNEWHRCGELTPDNYYGTDTDSLPDRNNLEHCMYLGFVDEGDIRDNLIYDCANRAINVYPDFNGSITGNVVDRGNANIRVQEGCNDMVISGNVVTNPIDGDDTIRWANCVGANTVTVSNNCVFLPPAGGDDGILDTGWGSLVGNIEEDPAYADEEPYGGDTQASYEITDPECLAKYTGTLGDGGGGAPPPGPPPFEVLANSHTQTGGAPVANAGVGELAVTMPPVVNAGDLLVVYAKIQSSTADIQTPVATGWTEAALSDNSISGAGEHSIFVKEATGSEDGSTVTFRSTSTTSAYFATSSVVTGADTASPIGQSDGTDSASSTAFVAPSVTTTGTGERLILYFGALTTNATFLWDSPATEHYDYQYSTNRHLSMASKLQTSPGATGTGTATLSTSAVQLRATVAIKPAP